MLKASDVVVCLALIVLYPYFFHDTSNHIVYDHSVRGVHLYGKNGDMPAGSFAPMIETIWKSMMTVNPYDHSEVETVTMASPTLIAPGNGSVNFLPLWPIIRMIAENSGTSYQNAYTIHNAEETFDIAHRQMDDEIQAYFQYVLNKNRDEVHLRVPGVAIGVHVGYLSSSPSRVVQYAVLTDKLRLQLSTSRLLTQKLSGSTPVWTTDLSLLMFSGDDCPFSRVEEGHVHMVDGSVLVAMTGVTPDSTLTHTVMLQRIATNTTLVPTEVAKVVTTSHSPVAMWEVTPTLPYPRPRPDNPLVLIHGPSPDDLAADPTLDPHLILQRYLASHAIAAQAAQHGDRHSIQVARLQSIEYSPKEGVPFAVWEKWGPPDTVVYRGPDTLTFVDLTTGTVLAGFLLHPAVAYTAGGPGEVIAYYQRDDTRGHAILLVRDGVTPLWTVDLDRTLGMERRVVTNDMPPQLHQPQPQIVGGNVVFATSEGLVAHRAGRTGVLSWDISTPASTNVTCSIQGSGRDSTIVWTDADHLRLVDRTGVIQLETHLPLGTRHIAVGQLGDARSVVAVSQADGVARIDIWSRTPSPSLATSAKLMAVLIACVGMVFALRLTGGKSRME